MLAMLHGLASSASPREIWWLYGARNREDHPFAQESRELLTQLPHSRAHVVYSRPGPGDRLGQDYDSSGHLSAPLLEQLGVPRNADYYLCGPTSFLSDFKTNLKSSRLHTEIFGPDESITPGIVSTKRTPHSPPGAPGSGPQVSFTRSGMTVPWNPRFASLLELAEACDISVRWACRTGVCHTCESALIGGAVDYDPEPLERPASGNVLICCSRPQIDMEIDL